MQFTIALVTGLVLGGVALALIRRAEDAGWVSLVAGLAGVVALAITMTPLRSSMGWITRVSIGLPVAALVFSIGAVVRGGRRWTNWAGLALAAVPSLFWLLFVGAEFIWPH